MTSEVAAAKPKEEKVKASEAPKEAAPKEALAQKQPETPGDLASISKQIKPPQPGYARPVMIHRAIYGSFERFIA
jgi:threonyl-tRNA synthetase